MVEKNLSITFRFSLWLIVGRYAAKFICSPDLKLELINQTRLNRNKLFGVQIIFLFCVKKNLQIFECFVKIYDKKSTKYFFQFKDNSEEILSSVCVLDLLRLNDYRIKQVFHT